MGKYKGYHDTITALYNLKTTNEEELRRTYQNIKINLIDTTLLKPNRIVNIISSIPLSNSYQYYSYLTILEKLNHEYPGIDQEIINDYKKWSNHYDPLNKNTIYKAIMNDDIKSFVSFTEREGFDQSHTELHYFTSSDYILCTLMEFCCIHGAVNCFKFLRTEFKSLITEQCLSLIHI